MATKDQPRKLESQRSLRVAIIKGLRAGVGRRKICAAVKVDFKTFSALYERSPKFRREVDQAEAKFYGGLISVIVKAAKQEKEWRAAAWILERRFYQEFGKRDPEAVNAEQLASVITRVVGVLVPEIPEDRQANAVSRIEEILMGLQKLKQTASSEND
jgi:hypothetical protein